MAAAPAGVSPEPLAKADAAVAVQVAGDAKAMPADTPDNIYELRSHKRRNIVLLVAAFVSVMLPFCGKRMFISPEPTSAAEELGGGGAGAARMPAAPMLRRSWCNTHACAPDAADTVYLPALRAVQEDLQTTATLVAASVAIYM
jgi:hypothetical protein